MHKLFTITLFTIIITYPVYGYMISIKEKVNEILYKTTIIKNVKYIQMDASYLHVEINELKLFHMDLFQVHIL